MIKNIEDLKKVQIVCRNQKDIEDCLNMVEELGFEVRNNDNQYKVIFYREYSGMYENDVRLECGVETYFFNKKFIKILQKFIKEKEEQKREEKEELKDFEVAEDGRITKINNRESKKDIYFVDNYNQEYFFSNKENVDYCIDCGLVFATEQARDKAMFKLKIETKLKNIAERLNKGQKIDWEDDSQPKHCIYYGYDDKKLNCFARRYCKDQGEIYCLDNNFLEVAKKEIGEENLIKYFTE